MQEKLRTYAALIISFNKTAMVNHKKVEIKSKISIFDF